ncbi:hypothetical protein JCM1393_16670 [Clostridium carnis]
MRYTKGIDREIIIINVLCTYFKMNLKELDKFLKKKENKYLLLLLLKNYNCLDKEKIKARLDIVSDRSVNYNLNKAQEKLLINKKFREVYFEIEKGLDKII